MKIAVTTPTGKVGRELVRVLLDRGWHDLILLARDPDKLKDEQAAGAKVAKGDLSDGSYVHHATHNVDSLFWVLPPDFTAQDYRSHQKRVIESGVHAVRENNIKNVVLLSSIGGHLPSGTGPITSLHDAEKEFSKVAYGLTILRPAFFMENFLESIGSLSQQQSIMLPVSEGTSIPMIATKDISAAAADALTTPATSSVRIMPLHGPRDYSFGEAARVFGDALGEKVSHVQIEPEQTRSFLVSVGASENVADTMLELYRGIESGHISDEGPRSDQSTTPTTLEDFARDTLAPAVKAVAVSG